MCKNNLQTTTYEVSIGDAPAAIASLRTYGLTEAVAREIIHEESEVAIFDNGLVPIKAISPELIVIFGEQHTKDFLKFAYSFLANKNLCIDWDELKEVLNFLIADGAYRPEEIATQPSIIKSFIDFLNSETNRRNSENENSTHRLKLLYELNPKTIKDMLDYSYGYTDSSEEDEEN